MDVAVELHLRIEVEADNLASFHAFLREAIPFYETPGGIEVALLADSDDPRRFIERIRYRDEVAYRADQVRVETDSEMKRYLARWRELLAAPPVVEVYRQRAI